MRKTIKPVLFILCGLGLSVLHFLVTVAVSFAYALPFLFGGNQGDTFLGVVGLALLFPASVAIHAFEPSSPVIWGLYALNSLLWGFTLCGLGYLIGRLMRRGFS